MEHGHGDWARERKRRGAHSPQGDAGDQKLVAPPSKCHRSSPGDELERRQREEHDSEPEQGTIELGEGVLSTVTSP